jgi:hypothetical protein
LPAAIFQSIIVIFHSILGGAIRCRITMELLQAAADLYDVDEFSAHHDACHPTCCMFFKFFC